MVQKKQYTAEFKFEVVLESFQRDTTIEEVCRKFGLASSVIHRWRKEFQEHGPNVFADKRDPPTRRQAQGFAPGESPDELKKLIGDLTVQNELLKKSRGLLDH
ncbi:MAG: transposase [Ktedonobacteraceae bacterium]